MFQLARRYEQNSDAYKAAVNESLQYGKPDEAAQLRSRLVRLLTASRLARGTPFAEELPKRLDRWRQLSDQPRMGQPSPLDEELGRLRAERIRLQDRKAALAGLLEGAPPAVRFSAHVVGSGREFFEKACGLSLEGIVSKRRDARYEAGRGRSWLKVKCLRRQEVVIGGFTEPSGSRTGLGALLVGVNEPGGGLTFAGKVGTGFTDKVLRDLRKRLGGLEQGSSPFSPKPKGFGTAHWVKPELVAEIAFMLVFPGLEARFAPRRILAVAFVLSAVRWGVMASTDSAVVIVAVALLHGFSFGAFLVATIAALARRVPAEHRAAGQVLFVTATFGVGGLAGFLLAGRGYDLLGGHRLFACAAALELVPLSLVLLLRPTPRLSPPAP